MIRSHLQALISHALDDLVDEGTLPAAEYDPVEIADPRSPEHGDFACNFALVNAKKVGMNPRALGDALAAGLSGHPDLESVEVAGPGFLNLRLKPEAISHYVADVLAKGADLPRTPSPSPQRVNVEFVSVNPNGPITIGSGRGAAFGSALCNVLEAAGHKVHREYYINDGVNSTQMRLFAESVQSSIEGTPFPERGYKGDYVQAVADQVAAMARGLNSGISWYQRTSQSLMLEKQRADLTAFGVEFDTWFSEQSLHDAGRVTECIDELVAKGVADDEPFRTVLKMGKRGEILEVQKEEQPTETDDGPNEDGAEASGNTPPSAILAEDPSQEGTLPQSASRTLWLRSTKFADDMDRVVRRKDGRLTYIASDVAYHKDKFNRPENADKLITILGPDHHGYINRLRAVVAALLEKESAEGELRIANRESKPDGQSPIANRQSQDLQGPDSQIYKSPEERDACRAALAEAERRLEVVIFQLVRFMKDGKPAPMRKRDGNIYALIDLIDELGKTMAPAATDDEQKRIGRDVSRFFYLMRSHDTMIDFDLDLATKQSDENPVFYAQYAHARICSVVRKAEESGLRLAAGGRGDRKSEIGDPNNPNPEPQSLYPLLTHPKELALIKKIVDLPWEVRRCAEDYGVHRLTTYAVELARTYHGFYDNCRVIQPEEPELSRARLALCEATRVALQSVFKLIGISAPERMERAEGN